MADPVIEALGISPASAKAMRRFDFLVVPIVFIAVLASFHVHFMLTAGDWDFWVDWKDRLYWPMITTVSAMVFAAAVQSILWNLFRLPFGATAAVLALVLASWVTRYVNFHIWSYFPMSMVWPATIIPSALMLDVILLVTRSWLLTGLGGGMAFAILFPLANWPMLAPFNLPMKIMGVDMTVADAIGFGYVRGGMPEYLRIIEGAGLRVLGIGETWYISVLFAGFLGIFVYIAWWWIAVGMSRVFTVQNPFRKWQNLEQSDDMETEGVLEEEYPK